MKFIANSPHLQAQLETWSHGAPLLTGCFYFCAGGTKPQRSLNGLYRALLYQMLKKEASLCRIAFPDWQTSFSNIEPSTSMLSSAIKKLFAMDADTPKFFIMIDGLDEYEADSIGKANLADILSSISSSLKLKLLLASRPEIPFEIRLGRNPSLRLETLTKPDISAYVKARLCLKTSKRDMTRLQRKGVRVIADFIVDNAEGVFLWVALVLNIAVDGIDHGEAIQHIRTRIMSLPSELGELFSHILMQRIPSHHRTEAFGYLLIVLEWHLHRRPEQLPFLVVALGQQAKSYEAACSIASLCDERMVKTSPEFDHERLESRCHGLLECHEHHECLRVEFLHRTLLGYLQEHEFKLCCGPMHVVTSMYTRQSWLA